MPICLTGQKLQDFKHGVSRVLVQSIVEFPHLVDCSECNGVSVHFDGNFIPVLRVPWTRYGHQTFSTCTTRDLLLYYVGLSHLSFPVWSLGGAKGFFQPSISRPSLRFSRTSLHRPVGLLGCYKSPHTFRTYHFRFGGQPPKTKKFLSKKILQKMKLIFPFFCTVVEGGLI